MGPQTGTLKFLPFLVLVGPDSTEKNLLAYPIHSVNSIICGFLSHHILRQVYSIWFIYGYMIKLKRSRFIVIRGLHVPPTRLPSAAPTSARTAAKPSCSRTAVVINHQASGWWFRNVVNQLRLVVYHPSLLFTGFCFLHPRWCRIS